MALEVGRLDNNFGSLETAKTFVKCTILARENTGQANLEIIGSLKKCMINDPYQRQHAPSNAAHLECNMSLSPRILAGRLDDLALPLHLLLFIENPRF